MRWDEMRWGKYIKPLRIVQCLVQCIAWTRVLVVVAFIILLGESQQATALFWEP